jgi:hypothetical protein
MATKREERAGPDASHHQRSGPIQDWQAWQESNPHHWICKPELYRLATPYRSASLKGSIDELDQLA